MTPEEISTFAQLRRRYPTRFAAYPPDLAAPTAAEIAELERKFECVFPPSFVRFQTIECLATPMGSAANAFGWASSALEPHMQLETILHDAREAGIPPVLVAFAQDEGNFLCFAADQRDEVGECPVVTWGHDEQGVLRGNQWPSFIAWLAEDLEESAGRLRAT